MGSECYSTVQDGIHAEYGAIISKSSNCEHTETQRNSVVPHFHPKVLLSTQQKHIVESHQRFPRWAKALREKYFQLLPHESFQLTTRADGSGLIRNWVIHDYRKLRPLKASDTEMQTTDLKMLSESRCLIDPGMHRRSECLIFFYHPNLNCNQHKTLLLGRSNRTPIEPEPPNCHRISGRSMSCSMRASRSHLERAEAHRCAAFSFTLALSAADSLCSRSLRCVANLTPRPG